MILPSKYVLPERALLTLGAVFLRRLKKPKTVSALWEHIVLDKKTAHSGNLTFDTFVLTLDFLYLIGAIDFQNGIIHKGKK